MPYIHEVIQAGRTEEHRKYYTWYAHPKGTKREKKSNRSEERIRQSNQRQAERKLRGLMNENFKDGDYLITLDFHNHKPRDSTEMQKLVSEFIKKLRYRLKKQDINPKYLYTMEVGPRGSRHVHMMIEKINLGEISDNWTYGGVHCTPLYSQGQYGQIASYFMKYALKTEQTEEKLVGKRWYGSRNLKKPKITKKIVLSNTFRKDPPEKKGWYLDKSSEVRGVTDQGYQYYSYTYIKAVEDESENIHPYEGQEQRGSSRIRDRGSGAPDIGEQPGNKDRGDSGDDQKRSRGNLLIKCFEKVKSFFRH